MFREPTKSDLRTAAGWTLAKRTNTTLEHVVALDKYRDGCEALLPFAPEATGAAEATVCSGEVKLPLDSAPPPRSLERLVADDFIPQLATKECRSREDHKFNIHTQRCVYCDQTRRQALGRDPELMVLT